MFKIKLTKKPKTGSQADYGLITNSTFVPTVSDREKVKQTMGSLTEEDMKNGKRPTIEVEGEEEVLLAGKDNLQKFRFKGPSHAEGGMPVDIPQGSFVYSKKLKMKEQVDQEAFGMKPKKEGYSFSDVAKKYDINTFVNTLKDAEADPFAKRTAQLMLQKNTESLAKLADKQEEVKGYPGGRPEVAKQVLGVPDVPAQVQEVPPTMNEAACGGSMRKAQWGESVIAPVAGQFAQVMFPAIGTINRISDMFGSDEPAKDVPKALPNKPKAETKPVSTTTKDTKKYPYSNIKKELPDYWNAYSEANKSKDPKVLEKAASMLENEDVPYSVGWLHGTNQDRLQDMAGDLRKKGEDIAWDKKTKYQEAYKKKVQGEFSQTLKDMQLQAYKYYKSIPVGDITTKSKAKAHAEKLYDMVQKLEEIGTKKYEEGYESGKKGLYDLYTPEQIKYVKAFAEKKGIKPSNKAEEEDYRANAKYDQGLQNIQSSTEEKPVVKTQPVIQKQVVTQRPVVQKPVQQIQPVQSAPAQSSFDYGFEFMYGGDLPHYQSNVNTGEVSPTAASSEFKEIITNNGTAGKSLGPVVTGTTTVTSPKTGRVGTLIIYDDGSSKMTDQSTGEIIGQNPAGFYKDPTAAFKQAEAAAKAPATVTAASSTAPTASVAPERHTGQFSQYGSPEIQKYLASNPNVIYTKHEKGSFGNQKLQNNTGIYLSSADATAHSSGNLSADEWKDFSDRHGDWIEKEYPGGLTKFQSDLATGQGAIKNKQGVITGHQAADWFQKKVNEKSIKATGHPYFTTGNQTTPYNADQKFGHVTYSVPRFFDNEKPQTVVEKQKEEPSKDTAEIEPGEPLDKMPPKTPGWYLPDLVNFGVALGQKTADFRPVKGSVNASMTGYTLEDPTTAQNTLQANQGRVQDQIENTTAGPVGLSATIGASSENAANAANLAANAEANNTTRTTAAFDKNAAIQNQQNMVNQEMMQKFVTQSADFGNNKIKEQNAKNAQVAAMFNAGTEHEFKRKAMEQVLFPQTAVNPITGDWYTGGKGRDIFGPDTYSPAYASEKGKLKNYEEFGKDYDDALKHFTEKGYTNPETMAKEYANKRIKQDDNYALNNKQLMMQALFKMFGGSI